MYVKMDIVRTWTEVLCVNAMEVSNINLEQIRLVKVGFNIFIMVFIMQLFLYKKSKMSL